MDYGGPTGHKQDMMYTVYVYGCMAFLRFLVASIVDRCGCRGLIVSGLKRSFQNRKFQRDQQANKQQAITVRTVLLLTISQRYTRRQPFFFPSRIVYLYLPLVSAAYKQATTASPP
jgi:hypothetical protein